MSYQPSERLQDLVKQLMDDVIDASGMEQLDAMLQQSPDARVWYLEEMRMHSALYRWGATLESDMIGVDEEIRLEKKKGLRVAIISAAAVILLATIAMKLFLVQDKPPILTFEMTDGARFTLTHDSKASLPEGAMELTKGSRLQLSQGVVELTFSSGVKSVVMAPADITLRDDDELFMREGAAWFSVPKDAIGFQVKTDELDVVDLGTEFAVMSLPEDHDEVHVFKGKVQVTAKRIRMESAQLTANNAVRIDPVGRLKQIDPRPLEFLRKLPETGYSPYPYLHWSFDELGDNGFPAQGNHTSVVDGFVQSKGRAASDMQVVGRFGKAVQLDGKGDWLESQWRGIAGNQPRTLVMWLRFDENTAQQFDVNAASWGARLEDSGPDANAKFAVSGCARVPIGMAQDILPHMTFGKTWCQGITNLKDGKWHCLVVTYTGETLPDGKPDVGIYVDGNKEPLHWRNITHSAVIDTLVTEPGSQFFNFGKTLWGTEKDTFFQGSIDEVYLFEGVLTERQIRKLSRSNTITCL